MSGDRKNQPYRTQSFKPSPDLLPTYAPAGGPWDALPFFDDGHRQLAGAIEEFVTREIAPLAATDETATMDNAREYVLRREVRDLALVVPHQRRGWEWCARCDTRGLPADARERAARSSCRSSARAARCLRAPCAPRRRRRRGPELNECSRRPSTCRCRARQPAR